jgi:hypothetical protein
MAANEGGGNNCKNKLVQIEGPSAKLTQYLCELKFNNACLLIVVNSFLLVHFNSLTCTRGMQASLEAIERTLTANKRAGAKASAHSLSRSKSVGTQ